MEYANYFLKNLVQGKKNIAPLPHLKVKWTAPKQELHVKEQKLKKYKKL